MKTLGLSNSRTDRMFLVWSAALVPIPAFAFYVFRSLGATVSTSEDLVTLMVMGLLGGPHVFATYLRSWMDGRFLQEERRWLFAGMAVWFTVMAATVSSVFYDYNIAGLSPLRAILTIFFFWASFHITQQTLYCIDVLDRRSTGDWRNNWWKRPETWVVLSCLYPISFLRMSMVDPADPSGLRANPASWFSQVVAGWSGSAEFANEYVFRIGRAVPVIPGFVSMEWMAVLASAVFFTSLGLFVARCLRERRAGTLNHERVQLVSATAFVGFFLPLIPNLDSAFQGFNAWHCAQYLYVVWLLNRETRERGEAQAGWIRRLSEAGAQWKYYISCVGVTFAALTLFLLGGTILQWASHGQFRVFGLEPHEQPRDAAGNMLYRPGSLLVTYYMSGFGLLLVHYLYDTRWFARALMNRGSFIVTSKPLAAHRDPVAFSEPASR
jgi:hypothetical protein